MPILAPTPWMPRCGREKKKYVSTVMSPMNTSAAFTPAAPGGQGFAASASCAKIWACMYPGIATPE